MTVSDTSHGQVGVSANVSVIVKAFTHRDLISATPLTLLTDAKQLVRDDKVSHHSIQCDIFLRKLTRLDLKMFFLLLVLTE